MLINKDKGTYGFLSDPLYDYFLLTEYKIDHPVPYITSISRMSNVYYKNEKIIVDLFLSLHFFMKGNKIKAFAMFSTIDINENSNFQRLDHNMVIYLFIKIIIEGASVGLELKFKSAQKSSHLDLLNYSNALGLNKRFA